MKPLIFVYAQDEEKLTSLGKLGFLLNLLIPIRISRENLDEIVDSCLRIAILEFKEFEQWIAEILPFLREHVPEIYVISRERIHAEKIKWIKLTSNPRETNNQLCAVFVEEVNLKEIKAENTFVIFKKFDPAMLQILPEKTFAVAIPFDMFFEDDKVIVIKGNETQLTNLSEYVKLFSRKKDEFLLLEELEIGLLLERLEQFYIKAQSENEEDLIESRIGFSIVELTKKFRIS